MAVSAVITSKNVCKFSSGSLALPFGTLDQLSTTAATATATMDFICNGSSLTAVYSISANDGLNATAPGNRRMANQTTSGWYMPYSLALSPTSGTVAKGVPVTLTATGTIQASDVQSAAAGSYQDTVVLTLTP